ncbi:DUF262 domain-containing protein [Azospirillum sp. YIM B02556]|uniref:DUF262 domain-containing protein n=1 Tax=Azospirillum endophyticum TaxID=2800326 RepID=A0ABS1F373_9PROT|nr:DUF262 domain-containing protein [Azospirillum endophyticum]MBK1837841.1 DUF262 domain-containing protein [Azospirillum endophyticum]
MSATNFNTKNDTFRKLMGNGLTYRVPRFQRDYSWGEEEWDDLWQDILGTVKEGGEPAHYMGYLVLQSSDDKLYDVIDGQQRLTTLNIIVLTALRQLKKLVEQGRDADAAQKRLDGLRQTYIGYLDPVTLVARSKLSLNRNNDTYFQTYLVPLIDNPPQRGIKPSENLLRRAFEWFGGRLQDYLQGATDPGMETARLIDTMSDRLFFTVITVTDELNAYKVFETLNARGVRLSATDLLKNYLFSVLHREEQHEHELMVLDNRWERIVGRLAAASLPDFLRFHWISRRSFVRQTDLFKAVRSEIKVRSDVFSLLNAMDEDIDTYLALTSPEGSNWSQSAKDSARIIKTFSVRQPFPLLMAAKRRLNETDFEKLLKATVVISFRYNVIGGLLPAEQERTYHAEAQRISKGEHGNLQQILEGLRGVYVSDASFHAAFSEKSIGTLQSRNRKIVRYILCSLERQMSGIDLDYESSSFNVEHICPVNPSGGWSAFTDEEVETLTSRLGNMTLLQTSTNKRLGNAEYVDKRPIYAESIYALTREIAENHEEWMPRAVSQRQKAMAKIATAVWRVPQLS